MLNFLAAWDRNNKFPKLMFISAELLSAIEASVLVTFLLFLFRYFQKQGILVFMLLAILVGNVQILKEVEFSFAILPLGTVSFSLLFLATNLLNVHYGRRAATKAVLLTFCAQIFFALMMLLTNLYQPTAEGVVYHKAIELLFTPSLRFFSASMISYLLSQMFDIYIFDMLRGRSLFTRFNAAVWISALLDNTIFSFLAFYLFPAESVSLHMLIFHYILGTYWIRVLIGLLETPLIYISYFLKTREIQV